MPTLPSNQHRDLCRETSLVVQAARAFLSGGGDGSLEAALQQPFDWAAVERAAENHSIMPILAYALTRYSGNLVPRDTSERFQKRLILASWRNLLLIAEWRRISQAFDEAKISVATLKGPALVLLAYPNFALREFTDLDLLIHPSDVSRARDVLVQEGYRISSPVPGDTGSALLRFRNRQLDFVHEEHHIRVDLHWEAWHVMFPFQLPVDFLFESARLEYHESIAFLGLSPENLLLYLCAHGTKHCWISMRWLCDVACHIKASQDLNWEVCFRTAEASRCDLVLKHSLLLAHEVLGLKLPPLVADYCDCAKAQRLADRAMSLMFRSDDHPSCTQELRFHLAFAEHWRKRIRFVFERLLVPAEQDWQEVRLPPSLQFLYYTIRPLRLVRSRLQRHTGALD
jgi:hypothetical protein